ncbi:M14 family metallopeptidase [Xanthomonas sp. 60]
MPAVAFYPVGIPGQPWGPAERAQWRARQQVQRRHAEDVLPRIEGLAATFERIEYGTVSHDGDQWPLLALRSRAWDDGLPAALVTGGVHGYETSGVMGALAFLETRAAGYAGRVNLLVVPCVNPWGYERINRWNPDAVDPNRNFRPGGPAVEATALMALVAQWDGQFLVHVDLHETTDSDETEFRPALAARDGTAFTPGLIPDGFYLVDDSANPQPAFQRDIITAVEAVTHIAPADEDGTLIGSPVVAHGVIEYPLAALGLCASITGAPFTTTTEVYPDSPRATPAQCDLAQVTAICAALDHALIHATD